MFYIPCEKVVHDQFADDNECIPVRRSKDKKVNNCRCFKREAQIWQEKKKCCRTVFVKTASIIERNKVNRSAGYQVPGSRIINPEVTEQEPAIVHIHREGEQT